MLFAVATQLADVLTFVAAVRTGVPLTDEANPLVRAIYPVVPLGAVVDLKLAGVAALVSLLALGERLGHGRSDSLRLVLAAGAIIGIAGLVGALTNPSAALSPA